jgi:peptidyl-dipeptidase Dcp
VGRPIVLDINHVAAAFPGGPARFAPAVLFRLVLSNPSLDGKKLPLAAVPTRYRSSYFEHIWGGGYAAGYYGYLWSEMLDDDAYAWFTQHGGLTRANGDRFRQMILSRGNSQDLETLYETWRGGPPAIDGLLRQRGLTK